MAALWLKNIGILIRLGIFLVLLSFTLLALSANIADPDLWGYMSFGRLFWQSHSFPYRDVFSYTPTLNPWIYHEWLTGVLFYPLYQGMGGTGLQLFKYVLGLSTISLVYWTAYKRGAHPLVAAIFALAILMALRFGYSPVRAQVFTFFFLALTLWVLERSRLGRRWGALLFLPLIQIPWCNLHGGFVVGLGLIAIYVIGESLARRPVIPYLLIFLLSVVVTLINPYRLEYWEYIARAVTMSRPEITEWASLLGAYQSGTMGSLLFAYLLLFGFVVFFGAWQSRWREVTPLLALAVTLVLSLSHIRHVPLFLLLTGAYFPVCFKPTADYLKSVVWLNRVSSIPSTKIAVVIILLILSAYNFSFLLKNKPLSLIIPKDPLNQHIAMESPYYPVDAVKFIKEQGLSGKILSRFDWGEYLIWELYPQSLVAFDGRYETVYPQEVEKKYFDFHKGSPGWRRFLEDYPPDLILLEKGMAIARLIELEPGWRKVYADSYYVLFESEEK